MSRTGPARERKDVVATAAGEQRYGKKIGEEIGQARDADAAQAQADPRATELYSGIMGRLDAGDATQWATQLDDGQLQALTRVLHSFRSADPKVVRARMLVNALMAKKGYDVEQFGAQGGGLKGGKGRDRGKGRGKGRGKLKGDDNGDGVIMEDESGWDAHTMGNRRGTNPGERSSSSSSSGKGKGKKKKEVDRDPEVPGETRAQTAARRRRAGDDNGDGRISAGESGWRKHLFDEPIEVKHVSGAVEYKAVTFGQVAAPLGVGLRDADAWDEGTALGLLGLLVPRTVEGKAASARTRTDGKPSNDPSSTSTFPEGDWHPAPKGMTCSRHQHGDNPPPAVAYRVVNGSKLGACKTHKAEMSESKSALVDPRLDEPFEVETKAADGHVPPQAVRANGRRAQRAISDGKAGANFTSAGRTRAAQLARGDALSLATVKRMHSYFERHSGGDQGKQHQEGTPAHTAWLAWGGSAGRNWARGIVNAESDSKGFDPRDIEFKLDSGSFKPGQSQPSKNPGATKLREYWVHGKGAAKIRWGQPHDFNRCVRHMRKYVGTRAEGLCNVYHRAALGVAPGKEGGGHGKKSVLDPSVLFVEYKSGHTEMRAVLMTEPEVATTIEWDWEAKDLADEALEELDVADWSTLSPVICLADRDRDALSGALDAREGKALSYNAAQWSPGDLGMAPWQSYAAATGDVYQAGMMLGCAGLRADSPVVREVKAAGVPLVDVLDPNIEAKARQRFVRNTDFWGMPAGSLIGGGGGSLAADGDARERAEAAALMDGGNRFDGPGTMGTRFDPEDDSTRFDSIADRDDAAYGADMLARGRSRSEPDDEWDDVAPVDDGRLVAPYGRPASDYGQLVAPYGRLGGKHLVEGEHVEAKDRHVRDTSFWGLPLGTVLGVGKGRRGKGGGKGKRGDGYDPSAKPSSRRRADGQNHPTEEAPSLGSLAGEHEESSRQRVGERKDVHSASGGTQTRSAFGSTHTESGDDEVAARNAAMAREQVSARSQGPKRLRHHFTRDPKGLQEWRPSQPGRLRRLTKALRRHVGAGAEGLAAVYYRQVMGHWPGVSGRGGASIKSGHWDSFARGDLREIEIKGMPPQLAKKPGKKPGKKRPEDEPTEKITPEEVAVAQADPDDPTDPADPADPEAEPVDIPADEQDPDAEPVDDEDADADPDADPDAEPVEEDEPLDEEEDPEREDVAPDDGAPRGIGDEIDPQTDPEQDPRAGAAVDPDTGEPVDEDGQPLDPGQPGQPGPNDPAAGDSASLDEQVAGEDGSVSPALAALFPELGGNQAGGDPEADFEDALLDDPDYQVNADGTLQMIDDQGNPIDEQDADDMMGRPDLDEPTDPADPADPAVETGEDPFEETEDGEADDVIDPDAEPDDEFDEDDPEDPEDDGFDDEEQGDPADEPDEDAEPDEPPRRAGAARPPRPGARGAAGPPAPPRPGRSGPAGPAGPPAPPKPRTRAGGPSAPPRPAGAGSGDPGREPGKRSGQHVTPPPPADGSKPGPVDKPGKGTKPGPEVNRPPFGEGRKPRKGPSRSTKAILS